MKHIVTVILVVAVIGPSLAQLKQQRMDNTQMGEILNDICREVKGESGYWEVDYMGRQLMVITDQKNNRMRVITPIIELKKTKKKFLQDAMEANFHKALDVKYATYKNVVWSIFVHPLGELSEDQFQDAIKQVYTAAYTYGNSYQSTNLVFGGEKE